MARKSLKKCCQEAEEIREKELRKRSEDSSALGDGKATLSYENLMEHEKCRSQWRKIKYFLKQGITEPLTRLLYQENPEGPTTILMDGEEIQQKIIDQNIKHFSTAENSPLGQGSFLHQAIRLHGTSEFCERVLDGGLGSSDEKEINFTEAYELLQHMERKKLPPTTKKLFQWIVDSISDLLRPAQEDYSNNESDNVDLPTSDPMDSGHPLTQPEISLQISRDELRKGFKFWKESTATSPSGRHL